MTSFSKSAIIKSAIVMGMLTVQAQANDKFELAVIEGSQESGNILKGDYQQSVQLLALGKEQGENASYEAAMSWCVAHIKLNKLQQAQQWCDKAVQLVENDRGYRTRTAKFKALALNNRAIVKYLQDDNAGAYQDFKQALALHQSRMVKRNEQQFTQLYMANNLLTSR